MFRYDLRNFGVRAALTNLRVSIAYRFGGFTSASR